MEETTNMTAERSLKIITEQIEHSRSTVSKRTGQSLYVAGLSTMCMAAVVAIFNLATDSPVGHMLWFVLPAIIWLALRKTYKDHAHEPVSFVATLVGKTWWTFAVFVLSFFAVALAWNFFLGRFVGPHAYVAYNVKITPIIMLLMGMAVAITGHILKSSWLVWFGIIASIVVVIGDYVGVVSILLGRLFPTQVYVWWRFISPCISVFIFAFIGLMLPGLMLKRQK